MEDDSTGGRLPPRMSDEQVAELVREYLAGGVVFAVDVPTGLQRMVFLPLALGGLAGWPRGDLDRVTWYGLLRDATGWGVNGFPSFHSIRLMLVDDFDRLVSKAQAAQAALDAALA